MPLAVAARAAAHAQAPTRRRQRRPPSCLPRRLPRVRAPPGESARRAASPAAPLDGAADAPPISISAATSCGCDADAAHSLRSGAPTAAGGLGQTSRRAAADAAPTRRGAAAAVQHAT
eukprot:7389253-Prymnesium_polylepis.2